jgi:hypothetical protein
LEEVIKGGRVNREENMLKDRALEMKRYQQRRQRRGI